MKRIIILGIVLALSSLTLSCGKNIMGPTSPVPMVSSAQSSPQNANAIDTSSTVYSVDPLCHTGDPGQGGQKVKGPQQHQYGKNKNCWGNPHGQWWLHYINKFNYGATLFFVRLLTEKYVGDNALKHRIMSIAKSPVFYLVVFKFGVGDEVLKACLRVLKNSWVPGFGTTTNGFDNPEITLFPFLWSPMRGFYGSIMADYGWGNGSGYHYQIYNANNDLTTMGTFSYGGNIYQNEKTCYEFIWRFMYAPNSGGGDYLWFHILHEFLEAGSLVRLYDTEIEEDGKYIRFQYVWAMVNDLSARCKISSLGHDVPLNVDMNFDTYGAGGGTIEVKNTQYTIVVCKGGRHGYWTKNGGHKHPF